MDANLNGTWRTVGGRRIFIKDGQDLASAMKESGKFNNKFMYNGKLSVNVSNSESNTKVMDLGYIDKSKKEDALKYYEDMISKEHVENAIIIQSDGKIIRCIGKEDKVDIYGNIENAIITHNHPSSGEEIGGSFGKDDLMFLIEKKNYNIRLRVVDEKYKYEIKVQKEITLNDYQDAYRSCNLVDTDYKHCVMMELKERGLIKYDRNIRK